MSAAPQILFMNDVILLGSCPARSADVSAPQDEYRGRVSRFILMLMLRLPSTLLHQPVVSVKLRRRRFLLFASNFKGE